MGDRYAAGDRRQHPRGTWRIVVVLLVLVPAWVVDRVRDRWLRWRAVSSSARTGTP